MTTNVWVEQVRDINENWIKISVMLTYYCVFLGMEWL